MLSDHLSVSKVHRKRNCVTIIAGICFTIQATINMDIHALFCRMNVLHIEKKVCSVCLFRYDYCGFIFKKILIITMNFICNKTMSRLYGTVDDIVVNVFKTTTSNVGI